MGACDYITLIHRLAGRTGAAAFVLCLLAAGGAKASDGPLWLSDWVSPVFGSEAMRQRDPRENRGMTAEERRERNRAEAMRAGSGTTRIPTSINSSSSEERYLWLFRGDDLRAAKPFSLAGAPLRLIGEDRWPARPIDPTPGAPAHLVPFVLKDAGNYAAYVRRSHVADGIRTIDIARAQLTLNKRFEDRGEPDPATRPPVFDETAELDLVRERLPGERAYTRLVPGDRLVFTVRSRGEPVAGASVTLITQQGWRKTVRSDAEGRAAFILIREDFPSWTSIMRRSVWLTWLAVTERDEAAPGVENGLPYERSRIRATLAGRTYPAPSDYRSQAIGLGLVAATTVLFGFGIFLYREHRARPFREVRFDEHA